MYAACVLQCHKVSLPYLHLKIISNTLDCLLTDYHKGVQNVPSCPRVVSKTAPVQGHQADCPSTALRTQNLWKDHAVGSQAGGAFG